MQQKVILMAIGGILFMLARQIATPVEAQPPSYCVWRGTAPFCAGRCEPGEDERERTDSPPDGNSCLTGTKALCCSYAPPTPGEIHSMVAPNRCLDADLGTIGGNGTIVQLWDCLDTLNQKWLVKRDGTIVNAQSGRCLDADAVTIGQKGTKVQLWDCMGLPNQNWTPAAEGQGFSPTEIHNYNTNACLDADLNTIGANGTRVQLWDCLGGQQQQWANSYVMLRPLDSDRCLDADTNTIEGNGTIVQLWDCSGDLNQKWERNADGTIVNAKSHRCLDADVVTIGGNGTKIQLWDCMGGPNQKWNWLDQSSGALGITLYDLNNVQSNTCLDADLITLGGNGTSALELLEGSESTMAV